MLLCEYSHDLVNGIRPDNAAKRLLKDWKTKDIALTGLFAAATPWLLLNGIFLVGFTTSGIAAGK